MKMYLGIDLGTSNSAIVGNDGESLRLFKATDGSDVLPSAIMLDRRGGMFVGKRAYEQDAFSPENVGKRFKRLMGTKSPVEFKSAGRSMSPEEASAEILKTLLAQAQMAAGSFEIKGTVITIPAAFNQMQCEATMRAAQTAGIQQVGLVQEPIAAAMASMADRQRRNAALKDGQFLVYDLGGGTFDVAIVQSVGGTINVVGHGGINMLGGSDFDRTVVNNLVRPWLMENFDLPEDLQKFPAFQRVLRIATFFSEKAKIDLSAQVTSRIFADETQIATKDRRGQEIFLDIPFERSQLESLVGDQVDRSIEACRALLKESGYESGDIDRIVFIGGPTRMPIVRTRVPDQLGIAGDLESDPMTAVAFGAAIFAESRDWSGGIVKSKATRTTTRASGPLKIEYGFPERTSDHRIRIRIRPQPDALNMGYRIQVDSDMGWTSGQLPLDGTNSINDVPVGRRGDNHFRVMIFDRSGAPLEASETRLTVKRTDAASAGTRTTHAIAVKVVVEENGVATNVLEDLVEKGHPTPASGTKAFRAARDLRAGDDGDLDFEVYQKDPGVPDPSLNLHVGSFHISSGDLERGDVIRRGDKISVHWNLDENGLLNCALEIPSIGRRFDTGKMFTDQGAQKSFQGQEGEDLANSVLANAQSELDEMQRTLGANVAKDAREIGRRLHEQRETLQKSYEADTRRSIVEEGRAIRQEISRVKNRSENAGLVLNADLNSMVDAFNSVIRPQATPGVAEHFDHLVRQVKEAIQKGRIQDARKSYAEILAIFFDAAHKQPAFVIDLFLDLARERHVAIDKALRWTHIDIMPSRLPTFFHEEPLFCWKAPEASIRSILMTAIFSFAASKNLKSQSSSQTGQNLSDCRPQQM
jgi:molecular chaperone DnaK